MTYQIWTEVASRSLEMQTTLTVVTPEQVERPPRLLLLLHGLTGNAMTWASRTDLKVLADRHNLAIVCPEGQRSFWIDQDSGLRWGQWVGQELPALLPHILVLSGLKPLIGGLSMGGYGAVRAAFDYPETFAGVISLSGTLNVAEEAFRGRHPDLYQIGFGDPDRPRASDDLVGRLGRMGDEEVKQLPPIFAACGTSDRLLEQNRLFATRAQERGLRVAYQEGPGFHDFGFWNQWLPSALDAYLA